MIKPLIISGPSGVGKTYLEKYLIAKHNFKRIQSTITRPIRKNELNGIDYNFISDEKYKEMENNNQFITSAYALDCWRGFEKKLVEEIIKENKIPVTVVVPTVVPQFLAAYPETIAIYLKPENEELLVKRMKERGDPADKIHERIQHEQQQNEYYDQIKHLYQKTYIITESSFDTLIEDLLVRINL